MNTYKYKLCLVKAWFEKGLGVTSPLKYLLAFISLGSRDLQFTGALGLFYVIFCFVFGYFWYKFKFIEAEIEVQNKYNLFVKEMRELSGAKRFKYK